MPDATPAGPPKPSARKEGDVETFRTRIGVRDLDPDGNADLVAFQRFKTCYEQNCEHLRSMNQMMWQVPIIAMTLTGGLWFGVFSLGQKRPVTCCVLLLFSAVASVGLVAVLHRVRNVIERYRLTADVFGPLNPLPELPATASSVDRWWHKKIERPRLVVGAFSILLLTSALSSVYFILAIGFGAPL